MVTIKGKGFPSLSSGHNDTVEVILAGGGACQVQASSYNTIACIAGPRPTSSSSGPIMNLYPGLRGMWVERYPNRWALGAGVAPQLCGCKGPVPI